MKRTLISAAVLSLAVAGMGTGSAAPAVTKITGGGQTLVPAEGGAGDTIAFTAQTDGTADGVKGQFQYVDRTGGTGQGQTVVHGTVTCVALLESDGPNVGVIGGLGNDGLPYRIDVIDNGQGGGADAPQDLIVVRQGAEAEDGADGSGTGEETALCDDETETANADLSRGNVKIHKAGAENGKGKGGGQG